MKKILVAFLLVLLMPIASYAVPVGAELLLLADVSGSVDGSDFTLQRNGYAAAFRNSDVIDLIEATEGGIAVNLTYWSNSQATAVGWTQITNAAQSNAFADAIMAASRPFSGGTNLIGAMNYGTGQYLADNGFEGERFIMDVSGDGADNTAYTVQECPGCQAARDAAVLAGVDLINALWIRDAGWFGDQPGDAVQAIDYGERNIIAGDGSFARLVQGFGGFEEGIIDKIYTELQPENPVPEPATMLLFGIGLLGLAGVTRKK